MTAEETSSCCKQQIQIVESQPTTTTMSTTTAAPIAPPTTLVSSTGPKTPTVPIELTENFFINNKRKSSVRIQVKLSGTGIYLRRETEQQNQINEQLISIEDIVGSRCGTRLKKRARGGLSSCKRSATKQSANEFKADANGDGDGEADANGDCDQQQKDISAYLYIYAYIKPEKLSSSRYRTVRILRFCTHEQFELNLKAAERWYEGIKVNKSLSSGIMASSESKPLLILLNPKSGSGKGRELFQKQVAPILKEAEAHYDLQVTTRANFARELVKTRKDLVDCYSGIVVASGDGLFYEVLNGLMERNDWRSVCHELPIGIIPCGSGNGLAKSIAYLYNEPYDTKPIMNAALTCVSGCTTPMDIVRVELSKPGSKPEEMYSFLSIGWGLIADIDIESERLRSIGAQRFTLWTIRRLISLRTYKGRLSYLPWTSEQHVENKIKPKVQLNIPPKSPRSPRTSETEFHDVEGNDLPDDDEFFADAISLDRESFRPHVNSWHSATSRRTAYYSITGESMRSRRSTTASMMSKIKLANVEYESRLPGPPASSIPILGEPLPDTWKHDDGDFIMVHAAYTTHLATDCLFAPESRLNDGIIYLVIIRGGCSRSQLLQFLLGMSTGTHIPCTPNEHIQVIPVRAFRIEPLGEDGIMAVDGERVDYGPIQAEIIPGMINVMVPNEK